MADAPPLPPKVETHIVRAIMGDGPELDTYIAKFCGMAHTSQPRSTPSFGNSDLDAREHFAAQIARAEYVAILDQKDAEIATLKAENETLRQKVTELEDALVESKAFERSRYN